MCLCLYFVLFLYVCQTKAHITIQIEPSQISKICEIIHALIHQNQIEMHPSSRFRLCLSVLPYVKSMMRGLVQMFGIMMTLVGANLITSRMKASLTNNQLNAIAIPHPAVTMQMDICKNAYGCNSNLCWRTCGQANDTNKNAKQKLCITTKPNGTSYETCEQAHQCSPCWSCLSRCQEQIVKKNASAHPI